MTTDTNRAAAAPGLTPERQAQRQALTDAVRAEFKHELSVPYGAHPKQILDIYYPNVGAGLKPARAAAPVLVFLHGGGFRNGAPGVQGYVGRGILEHGGMFIAMGYRLIPDAPYPDSCDDVELGLSWVSEHIAERRADPARIYLSGTSAGASLTAAVGFRPWSADPSLPAGLIKGVVLFSGRYDRTEDDRKVDNAGAARYVQNLTRAIVRTPPHSVVVSTVDESAFPDVPDNADAITAAIKARGGSVERLVQEDADHFSGNRSLVEGSGAVFEAVRKMMQLS